jgi:hypothetical protein
MFDKAINWQFQNEPLWRWFLFIVILSMTLKVWHSVLGYMKD